MSLDASDLLGGASVPTAAQGAGGTGPGSGVQTLTITPSTGLSNTGTSTNPVLAGVLATTLVEGMESPADKAKLDAIASAGWYDAQTQLMQIDAPGIVTEYLKVGLAPMGEIITAGAVVLGTNWTDAGRDGGALQTGGGAGWGLLTGCIAAALATGSNFGVAWSGKVALPTSGKIGITGLINTARTRALCFNTNFATDATHFIASAGIGTVDIVTTVLADASDHNFMITVNRGAGIIKWRIDGVLVASSLNFAGLADEAMFFGGFASAALNEEVSRLCVGYVARS